MKTVLMALFTLVSLGVLAQQDVSPTITNALSRGDASAISPFLNENVELVVGSVNDVFSRRQATGILADFFRRNRVSAYQLIHRGVKENSSFSIGSMRAGTNNYRVYVLVRTTNNQQLIQQLRIEVVNE